MKYVIISDLHVKTKKYDRLIEGVPESIYWPLYNLEQAALKAKELNAPLIIAGDINDSKRLISQQVITEVLSKLDEISTLTDVYLILGNHDYELHGDKVYSYLLSAQNITVIKPGDPLVLNDEIGLVAYNYNREGLIEDIIKVNPMELKGIVSHFGLQEGKLSGSEYRTGEFSLTRDFVGYDKWLILGHYHKPQQITDKVLYVGSTHPISIAEALEEKRYVILDTDKDTIESIPTVYPKYKVLTVDHSSYVDIDDMISDIVENEYMIKYLIKIEKGHHQIRDILDKTKDLRSHVIVRVFNPERVENKQEELSDISLSLDDLLEDYLNTLNIQNKDDYRTVFRMIVKH